MVLLQSRERRQIRIAARSGLIDPLFEPVPVDLDSNDSRAVLQIDLRGDPEIALAKGRAPASVCKKHTLIGSAGTSLRALLSMFSLRSSATTRESRGYHFRFLPVPTAISRTEPETPSNNCRRRNPNKSGTPSTRSYHGANGRTFPRVPSM